MGGIPAGLELAIAGHAILQLVLEGVQGQPAHKHRGFDIVLRQLWCICRGATLVLHLCLHKGILPDYNAGYASAMHAHL